MLFLSLIICAILLAASKAADLASPEAAVVAALRLGTEYNKAIRPPPDRGTANVVNFYVFLHSLVRVNSASQEVTLQFWLDRHWLDSRLSWLGKFNSTFDNISRILIASNEIWKPDSAVMNVIESKEVSSEPPPVSVLSNGLVNSGIEMLITFKCQMKMAPFPFDSQKCHFFITSRTQSTKSMVLDLKSFLLPNATEELLLNDNNEFCIRNLSMRSVITLDQYFIRYSLEFHRKPSFYITNLLFPSVLLLAISAFAFRLPPDCGERVSFSITIVLSMCVFLQLAGNYTPTQSEAVPLITWYFSMAVILTMLNVLGNVFVLNCNSNRQNSARITNRLIRALFLNRIVIGKKSQTVAGIDLDDQLSEPSSSPQSNDYATVVETADRIFFWLFFLLAAASVCLFSALAVGVSGRKCLHRNDSLNAID